LIELVGGGASARLTAAVGCLHMAQARGETTAWVQRAGGSLFPPDLQDSGIDLDALVVVQVPARAGAHGPVKAAELLLRSGGFGMVVVDLSAEPRGSALERDRPGKGGCSAWRASIRAGSCCSDRTACGAARSGRW
jgi:recombination protein RecA